MFKITNIVQDGETISSHSKPYHVKPYETMLITIWIIINPYETLWNQAILVHNNDSNKIGCLMIIISLMIIWLIQ